MTHNDVLEPWRWWSPQRHIKTCLGLTSLRFTVVGDLRNRCGLASCLHTYLAQDKEKMRRRFGWKWRGCESTIKWAIRSAVTRVSNHSPWSPAPNAQTQKVRLLHHNYLPNVRQAPLVANPKSEQYGKHILGKMFQLVKIDQSCYLVTCHPSVPF